MNDPRIRNLARILVHYSVSAAEGETVGLSGPALAQPLFEAAYEELLHAGAFPFVQMTSNRMEALLYRSGRDLHFDQVSKAQAALVKHLDATIRIMASDNTRALSATDPQKQARLSRATKPMREQMLKKKWVLTLFPTAAYAQDAEMGLDEFEDFVFGAAFADRDDPIREWKNLARRQQKLIARLKNADQVRIVGPDTDLTMSVKGRTFVNSNGLHNMPCGEIFTGPVESSAEGYIRYDYPVCNGGREVDGIRLVFRKGVVVEASAEKNEAYLLSMLDMDPGARRLGELGIGTNYGIQRFIKNILFDEKIGGSIHLALGQSYAVTGGVNKSALHWDMIKDLRKGGAIYVDGKLFQKNGQFVGGF